MLTMVRNSERPHGSEAHECTFQSRGDEHRRYRWRLSFVFPNFLFLEIAEFHRKPGQALLHSPVLYSKVGGKYPRVLLRGSERRVSFLLGLGIQHPSLLPRWLARVAVKFGLFIICYLLFAISHQLCRGELPDCFFQKRSYLVRARRKQTGRCQRPPSRGYSVSRTKDRCQSPAVRRPPLDRVS